MSSGKHYQATTENISANGVLFRINDVPESELAPGDNVDFLIEVTEGTTGPEETAAIHCQGKIIRSYQDDSASHTAAIIEEYRFQSEEEGAILNGPEDREIEAG